MIPRTYNSDQPINVTGIGKVHLTCYCINGCIVNGEREPDFYSFASDKPPGQEKIKEPTIKLFKKVKKSVLSRIRFYLENDDHKPVDFKGETVSFNCQLNKI